MKVRVHNTSVIGALEVVSLTTGLNGRIYGGYTGAKDHLLFEYDPAADTSRDLGAKIVSGTRLLRRDGEAIEQKIHHALSTLPDGRIVGGTGQNTGATSTHRKVHEDEGGHVFIYDPKTDAAKDLGIPVEQMWIFCTTTSPDGKTIYGTTYLHNDFFAMDLDTGEVTYRDQLYGGIWGDGAASHALVCDADGVVYGSWSDGYIFIYDPRKKSLVDTGVKLPGEGAIRIDSWTLGEDGLIYGGVWETGHFFSLEPKTHKLRELGCPNNGPRLPALVACDGKIYGAAGGGSQYGTRGAFLFEYDPATSRTREIGPIEDKDANIAAQRVHDMTVGLDGVLYAGETGSYEKLNAATGEMEVGTNPYLYIIER
jgi:sugar lactone lactonase YvrE